MYRHSPKLLSFGTDCVVACLAAFSSCEGHKAEHMQGITHLVLRHAEAVSEVLHRGNSAARQSTL